jgi:hypothetical protein
MDFYSCNGSKSGCEAERFGGCIYHRVGRWKKMAALRERIRDEAMLMKSIISTAVVALVLSVPAVSQAAVIFEDTFDSGASPLWGNEVGNWQAANGEYQATQPTGLPPYVYSSLPFDLTDFTVEVDIRDIGDGGIWLRSQDNQNGVILITGGDGWWDNGGSHQKGRDLYWHVLVNGVGDPPGFLSRTANVFDPGVTDATIRVEVSGDTYKAYVDGVLKSTLVNNTYSHGKIALLDAWNPGQAYERVQIVPEPSSIVLLMIGLGMTGVYGRRKRRATTKLFR